MSNKREPFNSDYIICSMCGKQFIRRPGSIYKVVYEGRLNRCCSYTCYQKALKLKEELHNEKIKKEN